MQFEPVIGLEVHAQLKTQTKIFCGCSTQFGAEPNTQTCPVCLGMPGVPPVLNGAGVDFPLCMALATGCTVAPESRFASAKTISIPTCPRVDFKLLLLGADFQAVSMLHYSEQRATVPYRYWKEFSGPYRTPQGWERRTYRLFARDLDLDARIELYPIQRSLEEQGKWQSLPLNYGEVAACHLADLVAEIDRWLAQDPRSLVTNRPTGAEANSGDTH